MENRLMENTSTPETIPRSVESIDFDALDLVRGENRSRTYSKKLDELTQRNHSLLALAEAMIREIPDDKKWSFEERLKKIKNSS
jgi:nucleotidyltransferase/DNA polymerase involved in DNA repair